MKKWEYKDVIITNYTETSIIRCLNSMGEEGWEYIYHKEVMEMPSLPGMPGSSGIRGREGTYTLYFKREKKE